VATSPPPKKRRKLRAPQPVEEEAVSDVPPDAAEEMELARVDEVIKNVLVEKTQLEGEDIEMDEAPVLDEPELDHLPSGALPSFPQPTIPDAPSKTTLALQGLDKHIIEADIVHPSTVLPIPDGTEDDGGTRLSEKTRRRLKDLGITELFAVQTSLIPYLIPQSTIERSVYRPFNPPRDLCVSAPTGSGKTLAYVLPILEVRRKHAGGYLSNPGPLAPPNPSRDKTSSPGGTSNSRSGCASPGNLRGIEQGTGAENWFSQRTTLVRT